MRIGAPPPDFPRPVTSRTTPPRLDAGLRPEKPLRVGGGLRDRLAVQVVGHVRRPLSPIRARPPPRSEYVICTSAPRRPSTARTKLLTDSNLGTEPAVALFDRFPLFAPRLTACGLLLLAAAPAAEPTSAPCGSASPARSAIPIGAPMKLAAELAAEEINAAGGIGGRRIELVIRDDYADPDSAVFIANDLYESGVSAVIGHLFSGMTLAAAPVYNGGADPVVAISPSSSSPELTTAGDYTFRICPSDLAHGSALAHWASERLQLPARRGALPERSVRPRHPADLRAASSPGSAASSSRSIPTSATGPTSAPTSTASRATSGAEFLLVAGNRGEAEEIIRQARRRGLTIPVLGGDGLEGIHEAGALAEGVYLSSAYFPNLPTAANRRFVEAYRRKYPGAGIPNQPAAAALRRHLPAARRDRARRAPSARRRAARARRASARRRPPFEGVTGTVAFDAAGDVPNQNVYIGLVRKGDVIVAEDATETVAQVP